MEETHPNRESAQHNTNLRSHLRKRAMLLVSIVLLIIGASFLFSYLASQNKGGYKSKASENSAPTLLPKYTMTQRFGAGGSMEATFAVPAQAFNKNGVGFYFTWDGGFSFSGTGDAFKITGGNPTGRGRLGGVDWIASIQREIPSPTSPTDHVCTEIKTYIQQHKSTYPKGLLFGIHNEIGFDDGGKTPEEMATDIVQWRRCLRSIDPSFQVGTGALLPFVKLPRKTLTDTGNNIMNDALQDNQDICVNDAYRNAGLNGLTTQSDTGTYTRYSGDNYFKKIILAIKSTYGESEIPDFVTFHPYPLCQKGTSAQQSITNIKIMRQAMKDVGMQDKDLIATEISENSTDANGEHHLKYMEQMVEYLANAKDSSLGSPSDEYRMVQRWAWFLGVWSIPGTPPANNATDWRYVTLYDATTNAYTALGKKYTDLASRNGAKGASAVCTMQGIKSEKLKEMEVRIEDSLGTVRETRTEGNNVYYVQVPGNRSYTVTLIHPDSGKPVEDIPLYSTLCENRIDCHTSNDKSRTEGTGRQLNTCPAGGYADLYWTQNDTASHSKEPVTASSNSSIFAGTEPVTLPSGQQWSVLAENGPTAVWESPLIKRIYYANRQWIWVYDRATQQWHNDGNPIDMSTSKEYAVTAVVDGSGKSWLPWTDNGPTAAWSWPGKDSVETVLCNQQYCWRFQKNNISGQGGWRDAGKGMELRKLNPFWSAKQTDAVSSGSAYLGVEDQLWQDNGITAVWTRDDLKVAFLCNKSFCRSIDYVNWKWKQSFRLQEYASLLKSSASGVRLESGSGMSAAWTSPATGNPTLCNGAVCWTYDLAAQEWQNEGNPTEFTTE